MAAVPSPKPALPGDPVRGQALYAQYGAACHGANLEGAIGPRLNQIQNLGNTKDPLDPTYLINTITHGLGPGVGGFSAQMPARAGASLSDQDIKDLAAFIIEQNRAPAGVVLSPTELAISTVQWVTVSILGMVAVVYTLARYNMRWVARKARRTGP